MSTRTKVVILVVMVALVVGLIILDKVANQPSEPNKGITKSLPPETVEPAKPTAANPGEELTPSDLMGKPGEPVLPKTGPEITPAPLATAPKGIETPKERGGDYGVNVAPLQEPKVTQQTPQGNISPISPVKPGTPINVQPAAPQIIGYETYTLKKGEDSWITIAKHKWGDDSKWKLISDANPTVLQKNLKSGLTIKIPKLAPQGIQQPPTPYTPSKLDPTFVPPTTSGEDNFEAMKPTKSTYTVKKNDTLSSIAKRELGSEKKWKEIYNANKDKIKDKDNLRIGTVLTIPQKGTTGAMPTTIGAPKGDSIGSTTHIDKGLLAMGSTRGGAVKGTSYTVQKGDFLWTIATKVYGKGNLYTKIVSANKDKLPDGADTVLKPGMILYTP